MTALIRRVNTRDTNGEGLVAVFVCLAQRLLSPVSGLMCVSDYLPVVHYLLLVDRPTGGHCNVLHV